MTETVAAYATKGGTTERAVSERCDHCGQALQDARRKQNWNRASLALVAVAAVALLLSFDAVRFSYTHQRISSIEQVVRINRFTGSTYVLVSTGAQGRWVEMGR